MSPTWGVKPSNLATTKLERFFLVIITSRSLPFLQLHFPSLVRGSCFRTLCTVQCTSAAPACMLPPHRGNSFGATNRLSSMTDVKSCNVVHPSTHTRAHRPFLKEIRTTSPPPKKALSPTNALRAESRMRVEQSLPFCAWQARTSSPVVTPPRPRATRRAPRRARRSAWRCRRAVASGAASPADGAPWPARSPAAASTRRP